MLSKKPLLLAIFTTITFVLVFAARYGSLDNIPRFGILPTFEEVIDHPEVELNEEWEEIGPNTYNCNVTGNLKWLERYNLSYPLSYASRDIVTKPNNGIRPSVTVMKEALFDNFETIHQEDISVNRSIKHSALILEVPYAPPRNVDASHMIFGLQTTMKRLRATKKHLARWLPNTGARLYAIVKESEEKPARKSDMARLEKEFRKEGMDVTIMSPVNKKDVFNQRYFSLVPVMYAARDENTQWVVIMDDDTFFPSLRGLIDTLALHDHTQPQYIGGLSENGGSVRMYGQMAFGGAGVFLSLPVAEVVSENQNECRYNSRHTSGDTLVMDCVYMHSTAQLTPITGLSQIDLVGDHSGFYENGRRLLSLHHWKAGSASKYEYAMEKMHLVAETCDECFLQRYQFQNDWVLTNGFSIAKYQDGMLELGAKSNLDEDENDEWVDLRRTEVTWDDKGMDVLDSLAPTRPELDGEHKRSWKFLDGFLVSTRGGRVVRQVYWRKGGDGDGDGNGDEVLVLNWRDGSRVNYVGSDDMEHEMA